jgi:hypothetical protein
MVKLRKLMTNSGMGAKADVAARIKNGEVMCNDRVVDVTSEVVAGDVVRVGRHEYRIAEVAEGKRLAIQSATPAPQDAVQGVRRLYCGYHKCLTMYFRRVFEATCKSPLSGGNTFRHFFHRLDEFNRFGGDYTVSSISGHAIDLDRYEDVRVVRFVRDPRDLVVSGYYYHKRCAEKWCGYVDPEPSEWEVVDGVVPSKMEKGLSFAEYLNKVSVEDGLHAELDFRRNHFRNMLKWPDDDSRVLTIRYEDLIGNEVAGFDRIFHFYGLGFPTRKVGHYYANQFRAAKRAGNDAHIRNANTGQWRENFTPALTARFNAEYGEVLDKLGYDRS